jgi:hypothetical protein
MVLEKERQWSFPEHVGDNESKDKTSMSKQDVANQMRIIHRYLGFFLGGILAVYAISGITLIFRDSSALKKTYTYDVVIDKNVKANNLGKELNIRRLKVSKEENGLITFDEGTYNKITGEAKYEIVKFPFVIEKLQHLHKAKTSDPLYFLNIFFGLSLLFFVISSFFMFIPSSSVFKKGMYFSLAGILLTLILLFL